MEVISLTRGSLVRIENARNMRLRVESGAVWITQESDTRDVMLGRGESFRLDRDGVTLISTFGPEQFSRISVSRG
jgi:hypothetical protein